MPNVVLRLITAGKPLEGHDGIVYSDTYTPDGGTLSPDPSVAFSPYGKCALTDKTIRIWDAETCAAVPQDPLLISRILVTICGSITEPIVGLIYPTKGVKHVNMD